MGIWLRFTALLMDLYFESAGMILTLITLGKTLEARAKGKTSDAITKLMNLAPKTGHCGAGRKRASGACGRSAVGRKP